MAGLSSVHYALAPMSRMPDLGRPWDFRSDAISEHFTASSLRSSPTRTTRPRRRSVPTGLWSAEIEPLVPGGPGVNRRGSFR